MFKQIVHASSNIPSLKAADKNLFISYISAIKSEEFFLLLPLSCSLLKITSAIQTQLPVFYVSVFQKLTCTVLP